MKSFFLTDGLLITDSGAAKVRSNWRKTQLSLSVMKKTSIARLFRLCSAVLVGPHKSFKSLRDCSKHVQIHHTSYIIPN